MERGPGYITKHEPKPTRVTCTNAARYINARGELCCSICPVKEGIDSIKLDDVPKLLEWCRKFLKKSETDLGFHAADVWDLRDIVQRDRGACDPQP